MFDPRHKKYVCVSKSLRAMYKILIICPIITSFPAKSCITLTTLGTLVTVEFVFSIHHKLLSLVLIIILKAYDV